MHGEAPVHGAGRDDAAVRRFVERFASILVESGIPRMPARVFAALLTTDSGSLTAAGLAEMLHVSPAAISGAVRYLSQVSLVTREREPGSRRDHYRLYDEVLLEIIAGATRYSRGGKAGCARDSMRSAAARPPALGSPRRSSSSSSSGLSYRPCSAGGVSTRPPNTSGL